MRSRLSCPSMVPAQPRYRHPSGEGVVIVVEPPPTPAKHGAQPTIQDVLDAIQDLSKKLSQLSKNQQTLESRLDSIEKTVKANYSNIIMAANYGVTIQLQNQSSDLSWEASTYRPHWAT